MQEDARTRLLVNALSNLAPLTVWSLGNMAMSKPIKVGSIYEGTVIRIKPYGLFVDVNGIPGLIRIPEISLEPFGDIAEVFEVGERVRFQVLNLNDPIERPHEHFNGSMKILLSQE